MVEATDLPATNMKYTLAASLAACVAAITAWAGPAVAQCDSYTFSSALHPTGNSPGCVATGDMTGDGILDLAVTDTADGTLAILAGTGGGNFAPAARLRIPKTVRAVELGDIDNDGDLDAALCDEGSFGPNGWQGFGMRVLWNAGGGTFSPGSFVPSPTGQIQPLDIALGDLDGDGNLDAVLAVKGTGYLKSKVVSFLGDGTGNFGPARIASTGYGPVSLALGDLDGDQVLDAVTANTPGDSVSVLHGNGDGIFGIGYSHSTGEYTRDIALGDFDGDGWADGAVAYRYGVHVLRSTGSRFAWVATLQAGIFPSAVTFSDLNGDGNLDLLAVDYIGHRLYTWTGDGTGTFTPRLQMVLGLVPIMIVAEDFDSDGDFDAAVVEASSGGIEILLNECPLSTYCVAKVNSLGCTPAIGHAGTPSLSGADDFHVLASNLLINKPGLALFGRHSAALPFGGGTLCVAPPVVRSTPLMSGGGNPSQCDGTFDFHVTHAWLAQQGWKVGDELFTQFWSRDPQHPDGTGVSLTNALRFTLQP